MQLVHLLKKSMSMKINSTPDSDFTLAAYFDTGLFKYLYFLMVILLYTFIVFSNLLLIVLICLNRSLHEPMYMFLCSLFVNELYGSTGLFPFLLLQILSDIHTVSASFCFLQIFCLYSYGGVEFSNLAIMSYDRYLAICFPPLLADWHKHKHTHLTSMPNFSLLGLLCGLTNQPTERPIELLVAANKKIKREKKKEKKERKRKFVFFFAFCKMIC